VKRVLNIFKPAPYLPEITDPKEISSEYTYWRIRIFYSMLIGYAFFYFTRKSFNSVMPGMITELGFQKGDLGIIGTVLYLTYGISKFGSGILSDRSNPRYFMSIGLILTGVFNIFFGMSTSILMLCVFWALNGAFQGWGWPPSARLLTHWYSQNERGRWWSTWNMSHNIGGMLVPIVVAYAVTYFGSWRYGMYVPAVMSIGVGFFLLNRLRDTPQSLGLPAIEVYRHDFSGGILKEEEKELSTKEILFNYVLNNKFIWLLALAYIFVYIVRTAVDLWALLLLKETKGYSVLTGNFFVSLYEFGGLVGALVAGWASDLVFRARRGPVNVLFAAGMAGSITLFWLTPGHWPMLDAICMFLIGFFVFGPQMLIGVAAAELSHKKASATATGFAGFFAYWGASLSIYPISRIADMWGWDKVLLLLIVCSVVATLFLLPLWNVQKNEIPQPARAAA
jgi:OPA family sugar phosphate sensor protein UhpC-like MFS transporter